MKDAYNVGHTSSSRDDPKLTAMRLAYGAKGYGWYWIILEVMMMREESVIDTSEENWLGYLSTQMGCSREEANQFLNDCINEFKIFRKNVKGIYSPSFREHWEHTMQKKRKAQRAARVRWRREEGEEVAKAVQSLKVLKEEKHWKPFKEELMQDKQYQHLTAEKIEKERNKCLDYLGSRKKKYTNYRAMFRNWLRSEYNNPKSTRGKGGMNY